MTVDDDYVPQPKRTTPILEPRVMRLEDLHDDDRRAVEKAIAKLKPLVGGDVVGATEIHAEAYCSNPAALKDFRHMQQINSDVTGRTTHLHVHGFNEPCDDREHEQFEPDPRRAVALGTNTR